MDTNALLETLKARQATWIAERAEVSVSLPPSFLKGCPSFAVPVDLPFSIPGLNLQLVADVLAIR